MLTEDQLSNRFDLYGALYLLCARYHSGRQSRGYRLLGRLGNAGYRPGLSVREGHRFESAEQRLYYRHCFPFRHQL